LSSWVVWVFGLVGCLVSFDYFGIKFGITFMLPNVKPYRW